MRRTLPWRVATLSDDPWAEQGFNFLERQTSGIGGGTTEMARNNISERVLGMPASRPPTRTFRSVTCRRGRPRAELANDPSGRSVVRVQGAATVVVTEERSPAALAARASFEPTSLPV